VLTFKYWQGSPTADTAKAIEGLRSGLPESYRPVASSAIEHQAEILSVNPEDLLYSATLARYMNVYSGPNVRLGEVYIRNGELFGVLVRERFLAAKDAVSTTVSVGHVGFSVDPDGTMSSEFLKAVEEHFGASLKESERNSERTTALLEEGRTCATQPTATEIKASTVLRDKAARSLMQSIKQSGALMVKDLPKQLTNNTDKARVEEIRQELVDAELLAQETVIVCGKSSEPILTYRTEQQATLFEDEELKCPCGKSLKTEPREKSVGATPLGRSLVDKSRWMTVVLVNELTMLGIPLEHIFIEQMDGGNEMDCLAIMAGDMVMFELKDNEFSLGHAYSFGAKVGVQRPNLSVVITTDKVAKDAKAHFEQVRKAGMTNQRPRSSVRTDDGTVLLEGIETVRDGLRDIGTQLGMDDAVWFFENIFMLASVHPAKLIPLMLSAQTPSPAKPDRRSRTARSANQKPAS
jgi:hypothetical protein